MRRSCERGDLLLNQHGWRIVVTAATDRSVCYVVLCAGGMGSSHLTATKQTQADMRRVLQAGHLTRVPA